MPAQWLTVQVTGLAVGTLQASTRTPQGDTVGPWATSRLVPYSTRVNVNVRPGGSGPLWFRRGRVV